MIPEVNVSLVQASSEVFYKKMNAKLGIIYISGKCHQKISLQQFILRKRKQSCIGQVEKRFLFDENSLTDTPELHCLELGIGETTQYLREHQ